MCGRYVSPEIAAIEREYGLPGRFSDGWHRNLFPASYNVAPTQQVPILRALAERGAQRTLEHMRWGLIPAWASGLPPRFATVTARAETLAIAPAYREAWRRSQRCIFPAAGFYEWHVLDDSTKQPYYVYPAADDQLFSVGGLWDESIDGAGERIVSCTVVTVQANELMAGINNSQGRMPLLLARESLDTWLSGTPEQARALLEPYPAELMRAHTVSKLVNTPKHNHPDLLQEVEPTYLPGQINFL